MPRGLLTWSSASSPQINRKGPWRTRDDVELATFEWVDWYNRWRIHSSCQNMPPVEYEAAFHMKNEPASMVEA